MPVDYQQDRNTPGIIHPSKMDNPFCNWFYQFINICFTVQNAPRFCLEINIAVFHLIEYGTQEFGFHRFKILDRILVGWFDFSGR